MKELIEFVLWFAENPKATDKEIKARIAPIPYEVKLALDRLM